MVQQYITSGLGAWFSVKEATRFTERFKAGENGELVSLATGSSDSHQCLFRTRLGNWVLHWWSDNGAADGWECIPPYLAKLWLDNNAYHEDAREIGEEV
jgi:hypothetical protein